MQKNYTGTQILAYMAAVQILSIPQLLNSPGTPCGHGDAANV